MSFHPSSNPALRAAGLALLLLFTGCTNGPRSGYGFALPDGDAAVGEEVFVRLRCNDCHAVQGRPALREGIEPLMTVSLGGKTTKIKTYGELVTSIINPSHRISQRSLLEPTEEDGRSKMRNYNDVTTISELIDLVAFLQAQYPYVVGPSYGDYE